MLLIDKVSENSISVYYKENNENIVLKYSKP